MKHFIVILLLAASSAGAQEQRQLNDVGPATRPGTIEIHGLSAGAFDPSLWRDGKLNLVRDARHPLLEPREGKFRNIYAPAVVQTPAGGWAVFYGAWDGVPSGNDRIYRADTADFVTFDNRRTVIEHGVFHHVCNVNATLAGGKWMLMCTAYPDARGLNKPAVFTSPDGESFNGSPRPHAASMDDFISMRGYEKFADADINGMNVLLREDGKHRMYFNNFRDMGKTFRASSDDGKNYQFDGAALDGTFFVNDVKKFRVGEEAWYLMGLHLNGSKLWYTLSTDGMKFPPARTLIENRDDADKYIVAVGFVVAGEQDKPGRRVLGFLYGAGTAGSLDQNRIFAAWLQKKVAIDAGGKELELIGALGPDRQIFKLEQPAAAKVRLSAEDGATAIGTIDAQLTPGRAYELR